MRTTTKALFAAAVLLAAGVVHAEAGGDEEGIR